MKTNIHRSTLTQTLTFVIVGILFGADPASAGVYVDASFLPSYSASNTGLGSLGGAFDTDTVGTESGFSYDLRATAGYTFMGVLAGFSYNYAKTPSSRGATEVATSLDRTATSYEFGPSLGYVFGNFRIVGTYFLKGQKSLDDTQAAGDGTVLADYRLKNSGGKGYQIAIGYDFELAPMLKIGPSLVYRSITYSSQTLSNALDPTSDYANRAFSTKATESDLKPMISLVFHF